jgi:glutamate formiminotransferase
MTSHSLEVDAAFWDVARLVKSQLTQIDIAQRLVEECQLRQATMAHLTDAATFVEDLQSQYPCQLTVTNLGRLELARQYGNIRVEALHAPAVMTDGRIVGAATLGDRLALTLSFAPLIDVERAQSERAATAFLSEGVKRLECAVVQDVMLKEP